VTRPGQIGDCPNGTMFIVGGIMIRRPGMRIGIGLEEGVSPGTLEAAQFAALPLFVGLCIAFVVAMITRETYPSRQHVP
jgi:hypothetical protein